MKKHSRSFAIAVPMTFMLLLSAGCGGGMPLRTQNVQDGGSITGLYTLILYRGGGSVGGLKTMAFLDEEGDGYSLVPYTPAYEYTVTPHISGQKALQIALSFTRTSRNQIRRILDPAGIAIGYEVRPLYDSLAFGVSDIMTVSYLLREGGTVQIYIEFLETVRKQIIGEY